MRLTWLQQSRSRLMSAPIDVAPAAESSVSPPPVEINFEPVAVDAPHAAAPEAAEIDISNEWEEMIEVEPEESPAPALEVQSYQEILTEPAVRRSPAGTSGLDRARPA